jgi:hypothetical protein
MHRVIFKSPAAADHLTDRRKRPMLVASRKSRSSFVKKSVKQKGNVDAKGPPVKIDRGSMKPGAKVDNKFVAKPSNTLKKNMKSMKKAAGKAEAK